MFNTCIFKSNSCLNQLQLNVSSNRLSVLIYLKRKRYPCHYGASSEEVNQEQKNKNLTSRIHYMINFLIYAQITFNVLDGSRFYVFMTRCTVNKNCYTRKVHMFVVFKILEAIDLLIVNH